MFSMFHREETLRKNSLKDIFDVAETLEHQNTVDEEETLKRKEYKRSI